MSDDPRDRVRPVVKQDGSLVGYSFYCLGCEGYHVVHTEPWEKTWVTPPAPGPVWTFNGSTSRPTFGPSLLIHEHKKDDGTVHQPRCHTFIREGRIQFLGDCGHKLAGQTVDMLECDSTPF